MWAQGARETILKPHVAGYTDALERGWRAEHDYLKEVCNEYHALIPWRLEDHEEPPLPLAVYNKFALPVKETLSEEETAAKRKRIEVLNAWIGCWLKYRARHLRHGVKMDPQRDPFTILLSKLAGIKSPQKHARFMLEWNDVDGTGTSSTQHGPNTPFRAKVARELFAQLLEEERAALKQCAAEEAQEAWEAYNKAMKAGPSKKPQDRQLCIDNLGAFMQPILHTQGM
ncbi:hypothetical protein FB451DRAFT_1411557 [Mycena latifolia]|nr:hypothetical protein FB451DRAFT_1411557 [Mycena latifolia]